METVNETVVVGDRVLGVVRPRSSDARLGEEAYGDEVVMPYWAEMWPSGVALARALASRRLRGLRMLELGCGGLALPSIVAGRAGARVLATDWSADAIAFAKRNARRSAAGMEAIVCSWTEPAPITARGPWQLVVAADVLYEDHHVELLADLLPRLVAGRGEAWIADPTRDPTERFLERMESRFEVSTIATDIERVLLHRLRSRS